MSRSSCPYGARFNILARRDQILHGLREGDFHGKGHVSTAKEIHFVSSFSYLMTSGEASKLCSFENLSR